MNHVRIVKTWAEFEVTIRQIINYHALLDDTPLLFRGHADADWRLATTLERRSNIPTCYVEDYFRVVMRVKPEIETYSCRQWDDINYREVREWVSSFSNGKLMSYEYLAYLRHHGFPFPLLV